MAEASNLLAIVSIGQEMTYGNWTGNFSAVPSDTTSSSATHTVPQQRWSCWILRLRCKLQSPDAEFNKLRAAQLLTFGLLFTLQRQGDRFSFQLLDGAPVPPPRSTRRAFSHALERLENPGPNEIPQLPTLQPLSFDHVYLISDLLRPPAQWESWLSALRLVGRECQCLRVLDPLELGEGENPDYLQHLREPRAKKANAVCRLVSVS